MTLNTDSKKYTAQDVLNRIFDPDLNIIYTNAASGNSSTLGAQTTLTATIANGASLSGEIDLAGYRLAGIYMPSSWTTANLTFAASNISGGTFNPVYDSAGNELTVVAAASQVLVDIPEIAPLRFLKIRSGTNSSAVNQGGSRDLILILKG